MGRMFSRNAMASDNNETPCLASGNNETPCLASLLAFLFLGLLTSFFGCHTTNSNHYRVTKNYEPDDQALYDTIMKLDSIFFAAYNTCDVNLEKYAAFFSDSIEFYHDKGGLMTSKKELIAATEKNICGKISRHLVKGSIEVYPIKGYGAVEIGMHRFLNKQESVNKLSKPGRFMIIWENRNNEWKIRRVVSLH